MRSDVLTSRPNSTPRLNRIGELPADELALYRQLDPERIRDGEVAFIQKPFTAPALLEKVRSVLKADRG